MRTAYSLNSKLIFGANYLDAGCLEWGTCSRLLIPGKKQSDRYWRSIGASTQHSVGRNPD